MVAVVATGCTYLSRHAQRALESWWDSQSESGNRCASMEERNVPGRAERFSRDGVKGRQQGRIGQNGLGRGLSDREGWAGMTTERPPRFPVPYSTTKTAAAATR